MSSTTPSSTPAFDRRKVAVALGVSYLAYLTLAYVVPRDAFWALLGVFTLLFVGYAMLLQQRPAFTLKQLLVVALLFRVAFIVSTPALSDDFYRFFWDGRMWWEGAHPLDGTPEQLRAQDAVTWDPHGDLWNGLNSREYSTVYPPGSQLIFAASSGLGMGSVATELMVLRVLLILLELAAVWLLVRILPKLGRAPSDAAWYAFNPLVVVEVSGNLHFEGAMVTGVLLAIWAWLGLNHGRKVLGFIAGITAGIAVKLLPVLLLPLLPRTIGWGRALAVGGGILAALGLVFVPFLWGGGEGFGTSVELFVSQFEFNASVYYIAREIGTWIMGYNPIGTLGPALKVVTVLGIAWIALRKKHTPHSAMEAALWIWALYLFLATTVHPWYAIPLVVLGVLAGRVWALVWSALMVLSYSHYQGGGFQEQYMWIALEYGLLLAAIVFEYRQVGKIGTWMRGLKRAEIGQN